MAKTIKIDGDVSGIKKSVMDLAKTVESTLGKSKVELISKEQRDFMTKEMTKALKSVNSQIEESQKKVKKRLDLLKKDLLSVQNKKKVEQSITQELKKQNDLIKQQGSLQRGLGGMGGGVLGKMGGLGKLGGMLGGVGKFLGPVGMLGGALAGVAGMGLGAARRGAAQFESGIDVRQRLRGRGARGFRLQDREGAAALGLSEDAINRLRLQSMDVFGREGASQGAVMQRAAFERSFGLETGAMGGFGAQFRQQFGAESARTDTMKLQASLIASGIEDAVGPYLETAANMLTSINENGPAQTDAVLSALAGLSKNTAESPERIAEQLTGIQKSIQQSSGEQNAFLQAAFSRAGVGSGSIMSTQAAIRSGGLFGADLGKFGAMTGADRAALQGMGIGQAGTMQKRAGGILDQIGAMVGTDVRGKMSGQQLLQAGRVGMTALGARSETEGVNMIRLLQAAEKGDTKARKKLQEMRKDPQLKNLEDIKNSAGGQLQELKALRETIQTEIGANLVPATLGMEKAMLTVEQGVSALARKLAGDEFMDPNQASKEVGELKSEKAKEQEAIANLKARMEGSGPAFRQRAEGEIQRREARIRDIDQEISEKSKFTKEGLERARVERVTGNLQAERDAPMLRNVPEHGKSVEAKAKERGVQLTQATQTAEAIIPSLKEMINQGVNTNRNLVELVNISKRKGTGGFDGGTMGN